MNDLLKLFIEADKTALKWYATAHDECAKLAEELDLEVWRVIAVVAVLSPKCPWNRNIEYARNLILGEGVCGALGPNKVKARRILELKTKKAALKQVKGPKVRSFYSNILRRGYDTNVTVDTHMQKLIEPHLVSVQKACYRRITERIQELARIVGYAPAQVQAVLWEVQRARPNKESGYHN